MSNRPSPEHLIEKSSYNTEDILSPIITPYKDDIKGECSLKTQTDWSQMQSNSQRCFQEDSKRWTNQWTNQPNLQPIRSAHLSPAAQSRALTLPSYSGMNFLSLLSFSCWWSENWMRRLVPHSQLWKWLRVLHPNSARPIHPQPSRCRFFIFYFLTSEHWSADVCVFRRLECISLKLTWLALFPMPPCNKVIFCTLKNVLFWTAHSLSLI